MIFQKTKVYIRIDWETAQKSLRTFTRFLFCRGFYLILLPALFPLVLTRFNNGRLGVAAGRLTRR